MKRSLSALMLAVALCCAAQTPSELRFDISTVKPAPTSSQPAWAHPRVTADGFDAKGVTLRTLLREAYAVFDEARLTGGPAWLDVDCYDVTAKIDIDDAAKLSSLSVEDRRVMLQKLLAQRFGIRVHRERRTFPVFDLVVGSRGSKLKKSFNAAKGPTGRLERYMAGGLTVRGEPMSSFAQRLGPFAHRTVVDHTGLTERYDISLDWLPDPLSAVTAAGEFSNEAPLLPKALEEQLGLQLKSAIEVLDVVIVDHAERPTPN